MPQSSPKRPHLAASEDALPSDAKPARACTLQVKKLSPDATVPRRGTPHSAGYDLASAADLAIAPRSRALVPTGLSMCIPDGHYGRVAPRSGLAVKNGIDVGAGVIDCDYRGELKVLLFNFGEDEFVVKKGERIAQLVLERVGHFDIEQVDELTETARGADGFGSTGCN